MISKQHIAQVFFYFFNDTATTEIYTLSLHDALPTSAIPNAEIEIIPNVTHYTFLARCNLWGKVVARSLCADPEEIDREEVHRRVSADALKFFNRTLQR